MRAASLAAALPLVCLSIALSAATAAAQATIAADVPKPPKRVELRLGTLLGSGDVGDSRGFSGGLHVAVGARRGDFGALAELQYAGIGDSPGNLAPRRGRVTRAALVGRWNALSGGPDAPLSGDLWIEGGVGYEHVMWNRGGVMDRPFVALGFGSELDARPRPGGKRRHVGPYIGIRTQLARGPESTEMPTCGGPCTRATRPSSLDARIYVVFGVHTGR
jgi:hypothetical protein